MATLKLCRRIWGARSIIERHALAASEGKINSKDTYNVARYTLHANTTGPEIEHMKNLLKNKFPLAKNIEVIDISGGCGGTYEVIVESVEFQGLSVVKQHRLVNEALKDEIKKLHGITIQTSTPPTIKK